MWEAAWLGPDRIAAIVSPDPGENAWYTATLAIMRITDGDERAVFSPKDQMGCPAGSPSGRLLAVIEAPCSDRGLVAGEVRLIEAGTGEARTVPAPGVDVAALSWIDDRRLGYAGIRGPHTVVGWYDAGAGQWTESASTPLCSSNRYPEATFASDGTAALVLESYDRPPAITLMTRGGTRELATLAHPGTDWARSIAGGAATVSWRAADGLRIEGILCRPPGDGPFPLVVMVHGGPVWSVGNRWMMRNGIAPLLVDNGYAVLHPNPRGSTGYGQGFARAVIGDMGGADAQDILAGIDSLAAEGIADPERIGISGVSYGGYMSSWIITQDQRFAAAVPMFPITNWYTQHHTSNIGYWDALYLKDGPYAADGAYHRLSPVRQAARVRTPTLLIAGALDRCTPAVQALEYHNALKEHGVETELVIYPGEGHGVRSFPARIDAAARTLAWFQRHMPAE